MEFLITIKSILQTVGNYLRRHQKLEVADPNHLSIQIVKAFRQSAMNPGMLEINHVQAKPQTFPQ